MSFSLRSLIRLATPARLLSHCGLLVHLLFLLHQAGNYTYTFYNGVLNSFHDDIGNTLTYDGGDQASCRCHEPEPLHLSASDDMWGRGRRGK